MSREKLENWLKLEGFLEKPCGGDNVDDSGNGFGINWPSLRFQATIQVTILGVSKSRDSGFRENLWRGKPFNTAVQFLEGQLGCKLLVSELTRID